MCDGTRERQICEGSTWKRMRGVANEGRVREGTVNEAASFSVRGQIHAARSAAPTAEEAVSRSFAPVGFTLVVDLLEGVGKGSGVRGQGSGFRLQLKRSIISLFAPSLLFSRTHSHLD